MKIEILVDAISDNFMKAVNRGPWAPVLNQDQTWVTFCNFFVGSVSKLMGCTDLWPPINGGPKTANEMCDIISSSSDWLKIDGKVAQTHANSGS